MAHGDLYDRLADHFSRFIVGAPRTATLIRILNIMFPPEEAETALHMPVMHPLTRAELQTVLPSKSRRLQTILARMASRGTVQTYRKHGQAERFALLPSAKGWYDTPYWAGRETAANRRLAPLWLKYRDEAFGAELAKGDMPIMRIVPVQRALKHDTAILPFEDLQPRIAAQSICVVSHCPCRQIKRAVGQDCGHRLEVCFSFGSMARYLADHGMGREITAADTLEIVEDCSDEGLVHCVENIDGYLGTLCNCCGCCCLFIDSKKRLGFNALAPSAHVAHVSPETCTACGDCHARCPMDAIRPCADSPAVVDSKHCIGCGLCVAHCDSGAVALTPRRPFESPADLAQFLNRKLASA